MSSNFKMDRRKLLQTGLAGTGLLATGWPRIGYAQSNNNKFLQIFLSGGWDSALATDPVIGSKASSSAYESIYKSLPSSTPSGKSNLRLGEGLIPAKAAFQTAPTAFINGLFVEVTAHDLASKYVLTGVNALNRNVNAPAFIATMGAGLGHFPAHAILGIDLPLGETQTIAPPLRAIGLGGIEQVLRPPGWPHRPESIEAMFETTQLLNQLRYGSGGNSKTQIQWNEAMGRVPELYSQGFGEKLAFTNEIRDAFNVPAGSELSQPGMLASAFLLLSSGLTPYVTVSTHGYDTHKGHYPAHTSLLQEFAGALPVLINKMANTPDPDVPSASLLETTTILITSEFVRTPKFNVFGGTDHWQSGSAILMGRGVTDNKVVGGTDNNAKAMGWNGSSTVAASDGTHIRPEHLAATLLRYFGFQSQANSLTNGNIDGILG